MFTQLSQIVGHGFPLASFISLYRYAKGAISYLYNNYCVDFVGTSITLCVVDTTDGISTIVLSGVDKRQLCPPGEGGICVPLLSNPCH